MSLPELKIEDRKAAIQNNDGNVTIVAIGNSKHANEDGSHDPLLTVASFRYSIGSKFLKNKRASQVSAFVTLPMEAIREFMEANGMDEYEHLLGADLNECLENYTQEKCVITYTQTYEPAEWQLDRGTNYMVTQYDADLDADVKVKMLNGSPCYYETSLNLWDGDQPMPSSYNNTILNGELEDISVLDIEPAKEPATFTTVKQ